MAEKENKTKKSKDTLFERYKLIITARNFHYENFNKWLTYFYVANAAIFLGYMQSLSAKIDSFVSLSILFLGFISGLLLYWSSKGYYYWNINFIMLVNYYEKELLKWKKKERVYAMFANKDEQNNYFNPTKGANFSTSKIAILFAFIIAFFWGTSLFYSILCELIFLNKWFILLISVILSFGFVSVLGQIKKKNKQHVLWSNTDPLYNLKIEQ